MELTLGSPLYMAPELCKMKEYDERVDIFSLGTIVYIMLSGSPPFHGNNDDEIKAAIIKGELDMSLVKANDEAIDFIMKCLKKDYSKRPRA